LHIHPTSCTTGCEVYTPCQNTTYYSVCVEATASHNSCAVFQLLWVWNTLYKVTVVYDNASIDPWIIPNSIGFEKHSNSFDLMTVTVARSHRNSETTKFYRKAYTIFWYMFATYKTYIIARRRGLCIINSLGLWDPCMQVKINKLEQGQRCADPA